MSLSEEENFLRIVYLHYRVVTPSLKTFFDGKFPSLSAELNLPQNKKILSNLKNGRPRILFQQQWDTLFPPVGCSPVSSADLDVTLMVCLLRNIPPCVVPPINGFNELPPKSEQSVGAHLARIKFYKNFIVSHSTNGTIPCNEFSVIWTDLEMAIKGLGNQQDIDNANLAKSKILDGSITTLLSILQQLESKVSIQQDQMRDMKCSHAEVLTKYKTVAERMEMFEANTQEMKDENHEDRNRVNTRIEALEKNHTDLQNYKVNLSKQLWRIEQSGKKVLKAQVESYCMEIQRYFYIHAKSLAALQMKANNIVQLLDVRQTRPDWMVKVMKQWKKDDNRFVKTRASKKVIDCILKHVCVAVVGPSGVGKTFLVQHVALELEKLGFTIMKVNSPKEIKTNYILGCKILFVVDDMCGNFTANRKKLDQWKQLMKNEINVLLRTETCKLIFTCRLQVFYNVGFMYSDLALFRNCVCNLVDTNISLTDLEKRELAILYFKEIDIKKLQHLFIYDFFPFICKSYDDTKNSANFCLESFLKNPFDCYVKEMNNMYIDSEESKYKFSALLLLVVSNNHLEKNFLLGKGDEINFMLEETLKECDIERRLTGKCLLSELDNLTGTFVSNDKGVYRAIHDKLFDFLAYYFGTYNDVTRNDFRELLIKHAEKNFIRERFIITQLGQPDGTRSEKYLINVQGYNLKLYIGRIFDEMTKSNSIDSELINNRNSDTEIFQNELCFFMKQMTKDKKTSLIQNASTEFIYVMFVMDEHDIVLSSRNRYGIILEHDQLQTYIERMFHDLTKSSDVENCILKCRSCRNESFRKELLAYMGQISSSRIAELITSANSSFIQKMFVMSVEDIEQSTSSIYKLYGIELSDEHIERYMERIFYEITIYHHVPYFLERCRSSGNIKFQTNLETIMSKLSSTSVVQLVNTASSSFVQSMLIMTEKESNHGSIENYKRYGIEIPDGVIQIYIARVFDDLTISKASINENRNKQNPLFHDELLAYMGKLGRSKIEHLINSASKEFINELCVISFDDIKENSDLEYERYGVIIPNDCIDLYVGRWFDELKQNAELFSPIGRSRRNKFFQKTLQKYMTQLQEDEIEILIQTACDEFLNKYFVTEREDIQNDSSIEFENYGIVLQGQNLQIYCDRIWDIIEGSGLGRVMINRNYRGLFKYMSQQPVSRITKLIQRANNEIVVMMKVDLKNAPREKKISLNCQCYICAERHICFNPGAPKIKDKFLTIPEILISQYIDRIICEWERGQLDAIIQNINLKNPFFIEKLLDHLNNLEPSKIVELVSSINQISSKSVEIGHCSNETNTRDHISALTMCCLRGDLCLTKWCIETLFCGNKKEKHNKMCALLLLVVFDNELPENISNDKLSIIDDVVYLFRKMYNIDEKIPIEVLKKELDTSFNGMVLTKPYRVKYEMVFNYLVFYFGSIQHMLHIITKHANVRFICNQLLMNKPLHKEYYKLDLPEEELQRCVERVFWVMSKHEVVLKYILDKKNHINMKPMNTYIKKLGEEEIKTLIEYSCIEFVNKMFVIQGEGQKGIDDEIEPIPIAITDDTLCVYIKRMIYNLFICNCIASCLQGNRNRSVKSVHTELSFCFQTFDSEDVHNIIKHASSDFIFRLLVISKEDIKDESYWEYERYGIVVPEELLHMYIKRVFYDMTKSFDVTTNRNSENKTFREALHLYTSSFPEDTLIALLKTASSRFVRKIFLSTEAEFHDICSPKCDCCLLFIPKKYFQLCKQQWPKPKPMSCIGSNTILVIEDDSGTFEMISNEDDRCEDVLITVKRKHESSIEELQRHLSRYVDPVFTRNNITCYVSPSESLKEKYMNRMIVDWMEGHVHAVLRNINFSKESFLSEFLNKLRQADEAEREKLTNMTDNITGDSSLAVSCYAGCAKLVRWFLDNNANINSYNKYDETPLYIAISQNHSDITSILLNSKDKADVNKVSNFFENTPLIEACGKGNNTIVSLLLDENLDVNFADYSRSLTPLYFACKHGHTETVSLLLERKADKITINKGAMTPLYIACKEGHTKIVSILLKHKADEVDVNKQTPTGETALYAACEGRYKDIVDLLLSHEPRVINKSVKDGTTPLFVACRQGHDEIVSTLLNKTGIEINKCSVSGITPLLVASLLGHTKIVAKLLRKEADVNVCVKTRKYIKREFENFNYSVHLKYGFKKYLREQAIPIYEAFIENASEHVKRFLDGREEDWLFNSILGSSALHMASAMGNIEIVKLIVGKTSNLNCFNEEGSTPLLLACECGHRDIVRVLLANGANPILIRQGGQTALTIARNNGYMEIVEMLKSQTLKSLIKP